VKQPPRAPAPTSPVILRSAGHDRFKITTHEFVRYEELEPDQLKYSSDHGPRALDSSKPRALIYRCTETGAERRWGIE
jgi:hypothetical protein